MAFEIVSPLIPSYPGAKSSLPVNTAFAKSLSIPTCCSPLPLTGISHFQSSGFPKGWVFSLLNSRSETTFLLKIVPELLQENCSEDKILYYVSELIKHKDLYQRQMDGFEKVRKILGLGEQTPSDNAADIIFQIAENKKK